VAGALANAGRPVLLLLRAEALEEYPGGLHLESRVLGEVDVDVPAAARLDRPVDVLWVTVKATQLEAALQVASPAVAPDALVVPLLNGVDHVRRLREVYGPVVVPGAIRVESERLGPGHILQVSQFAQVELGAPPQLRQRADAVAAELEEAGLSCRVSDDEDSVLWRKLVILAPFAMASTSAQKDGAEFLTDERTRELMVEAGREAVAVAATQGVEVDTEANERMLLGMAGRMRSSMQKDLAAGRPLELEAIAGPILRLGKQHGVPTPATRELVSRIAAAKAL
jgi:2-dehydropantoate 2-reductase